MRKHDWVVLIKPVIALGVAVVAGPVVWLTTRDDVVTAVATVAAAVAAWYIAFRTATRHLERADVESESERLGSRRDTKGDMR